MSDINERVKILTERLDKVEVLLEQIYDLSTRQTFPEGLLDKLREYRYRPESKT